MNKVLLFLAPLICSALVGCTEIPLRSVSSSNPAATWLAQHSGSAMTYTLKIPESQVTCIVDDTVSPDIVYVTARVLAPDDRELVTVHTIEHRKRWHIDLFAKSDQEPDDFDVYCKKQTSSLPSAVRSKLPPEWF